MKRKTTLRGFAVWEFQDRGGTACTLQKSSLATDDCIWLGANEIGLRRFTPGQVGWQDVPLEDGPVPDRVSHVANNRMHLDRRTVKNLLPILQKFVDTGEV